MAGGLWRRSKGRVGWRAPGGSLAGTGLGERVPRKKMQCFGLGRGLGRGLRVLGMGNDEMRWKWGETRQLKTATEAGRRMIEANNINNRPSIHLPR